MEQLKSQIRKLTTHHQKIHKNQQLKHTDTDSKKVDHEGKGLPNAEFIVKNNIEGADKGKVLAQKEAKDLAADEAAYQAAEKHIRTL